MSSLARQAPVAPRTLEAMIQTHLCRPRSASVPGACAAAARQNIARLFWLCAPLTDALPTWSGPELSWPVDLS